MFDLMTQMYSELQNLSGQVGKLDARLTSLEDKVDEGFSRVDQRFTKVEEDIARVEQRVAKVEKDIIRLEDKVENSSRALFDGYTQSYEKLSMVDDKLDALSIQVEKQDVEIKVIRNVGIN